MEIFGGGRTIFNRSAAVGALPESPPTTVSDGYSILLEARLGGGVIPPYVLVLADLEGGTTPTVTLDAYLYFPYAQYLDKWQLIKRSILSDDYSQAYTFMLVPSLGAARIAICLQSVTGAPTDIHLHGRAINDDQAFQLLDIQDGGGGGSVALSDIPPLDVTSTPASAGVSSEASRQDHKHYIDFNNAHRAEAECLMSDSVGNVVYIRDDLSAGRYSVETADPASFSKMPAIGMIIGKSSDTLCTIQFRGEISGIYSGLTPGELLFVGDTGALVSSMPTPTPSVKKFAQIMGVALASNIVGLDPDFTLTRRRN